MAMRMLCVWPVTAALALFGVAAECATLTLSVSNPYCVALQPRLNRCSINIRAISAAASDTSFSGIEIAVDGKMRIVETGFFEASGIFYRQMAPDGLAVVCGLEGQSGVSGFGLIHFVTISASLYGSSPITDTANVTCPPASDHIFGDGYEPGGAG